MTELPIFGEILKRAGLKISLSLTKGKNGTLMWNLIWD